MQLKNSIAAGKSDGAAKAEQASAHSKDLASSRRMNVQMAQNVLLIWLDNNIDEISTDYRNTITQLRRGINTINTFTDGEECVQFLENINKEKACMIISGSLGQDIVPRVHDMFQLDSIFIFCAKKESHEQWAKEWSKIKGVFTEISPICEALKQAAQQCEQNAISISFMSTNGDISKKNLDQLDPSFMYTQILKEILLEIEFKPTHFTEFIDYCRGVFIKNDVELKNVKKFERKYLDETPIWWYTFECFLYPMLNRALRLIDVGIIIKIGFFLGDLHRHIEQLHKEQFRDQNSATSFTVYRGQGMSKSEFEQMTETKDGLISFNNFLSTNKNCTISLSFAQRAVKNPDLMGILFVMTIDPSQSTIPFASIVDVSYFKDKEGEVLFAMNTVFRICNITPMGENHRLFQVDLTLTSDNDKDLRVLTDRIREETFPEDEGWSRLGLVLLQMGQFNKAEEVYEILLGQTTIESEKASIYHQLGIVKFNQGEYQKAATFYEKSIEIERKVIPLNHHGLANSTVTLGNVYYSMGEYQKALSLHEEALQIYQKILPPNHSDLAASYNNIGEVYRKTGEYSKALSSHEKALEIQQQSLPPNHPHLAASYNNIADVYSDMSEYSKALSSYEKALEIRQQSLPPNHPDLGSSYYNIGLMYKNMGEYSKALFSHEKALEIEQQSLPPNHPDLAVSYNNIANLYSYMGEYSKALSSHEKALEIEQQSLPPNHPDLAASYNNIANLYSDMGEYSKALSSYEKALEIQQKTLPPNHIDFASLYDCIGVEYDSLGQYSKALSFFEKGLEIRRKILPPNHFNIAGSYTCIGWAYKNMGEYSKALSFYEKGLEIEQKAFPSIHPILGNSYNNVGEVYSKMGNYSEALSFLEKAVDIDQKTLPPNHRNLAEAYNNIGDVYDNTAEYSKALSFYQRAVDIGQCSLPPNHPFLQKWRKNLESVRKRL
jgi:tetratricopeptide (TPR) repeat protein